MRPVESLQKNKRKSKSPHRSTKKRRSGEGTADDTDVIVIDSDSDSNDRPSGSLQSRVSADSLDPSCVLKAFRITVAQLGRVSLLLHHV